jgi:hypothetical protein
MRYWESLSRKFSSVRQDFVAEADADKPLEGDRVVGVDLPG